MPIASPRYSPVGSKLSVNPNACSQPVLRTPPLETSVFAEPAAETIAAVTAAVTRTAEALRSGCFTSLCLRSLLLPPSARLRRREDAVTARFDAPADDRLGRASPEPGVK